MGHSGVPALLPTNSVILKEYKLPHMHLKLLCGITEMIINELLLSSLVKEHTTKESGVLGSNPSYSHLTLRGAGEPSG